MNAQAGRKSSFPEGKEAKGLHSFGTAPDSGRVPNEQSFFGSFFPKKEPLSFFQDCA
jgi:hypothetical protein